MAYITSGYDKLPYYVSIPHRKALKPVKQAFPQAYIIPYMDDILLATSKKKGL